MVGHSQGPQVRVEMTRSGQFVRMGKEREKYSHWLWHQNNDKYEKSYRYDVKTIVMSHAPLSPAYQAFYMLLLTWLKSCPLCQAPRALPPSPAEQLCGT